MGSLSDFVGRCDDFGRLEPNRRDRAFADTLNAANRLMSNDDRFSGDQLAERFGVPPAMFALWAQGAARPGLRVQNHVVDELKKMAVQANSQVANVVRIGQR